MDFSMKVDIELHQRLYEHWEGQGDMEKINLVWWPKERLGGWLVADLGLWNIGKYSVDSNSHWDENDSSQISNKVPMLASSIHLYHCSYAKVKSCPVATFFPSVLRCFEKAHEYLKATYMREGVRRIQ